MNKRSHNRTEPDVLEPLLLDEDAEVSEDDGVDREKAIASLRLLWSHRGWLWKVALYGLIASALIAFLIPARYESVARLMPPGEKQGGLAMLAAVTGAAPGLGALAGDLLGMKNDGAVLVGVLASRTVQDRLIEKFGLLDLYAVSSMEGARTTLGGRTDVSEDRKSGIIEIKTWDNDPERARAMAATYVAELDRLVAEVSTSAARRERVFIEERLKVVKQELDQAAREFSQFASKNSAIDIKEQGRAMVEAAATLQGQMIVAQTELESLRQVYTDSNVRVRAVRARIAELKDQLGKLSGGDLPGSSTPSDGDAIYPSIRKLPLLGVTYADLYRRTKVAEVVYELLTQQYELAKVQEAKEIPSVQVLDAPVLPEKKSFPPRMLFAALGTFLAFGAGVAWILARERWRSLDREDPGRRLGEEVVRSVRGAWTGNGLHRPRLSVWRTRLLRRQEPETRESEVVQQGEKSP